MKKIVNISLLILLISGCSYDTNSEVIEKGKLETTVFFASDLHLYSNNLISENNQNYIKEMFTSDGRVQEYDYELVNELVNKVNESNPDFLVLTGDLSYNGEKDSLIELSKLLDKVNDTKVLVIPGNHDCYSISSFSVKNDKYLYEENATYDDFKEIFNEYGYSDAYSYDRDSLSYIYELSNNKWILMLDTSLSEYNDEYDMNMVGGFVDESTLSWLENNLKYAKDNNIDVISATHHNLLVHNELFKDRYTISNSDALLGLYSKYDVKLNFSGHLHIQSIKNMTLNDKTIYDIASGSLLDYGNRYGKLEIYDNCYNYESYKIDKLDNKEDFSNYSFDVFYQKYYNKSIKSNERIYGRNALNVTDFISKVNAYYFDGDYQNIYKLKKENKSLYRKIKRKTDKYNESYVGTMLEVNSNNQHQLLIRK